MEKATSHLDTPEIRKEAEVMFEKANPIKPMKPIYTIKVEIPPVWDNAMARFRINPRTVLFAYGDTIYNPGNVDLEKADDIIAHEEVHLMQQKNSREEAALWWGKYMRDPQFLLSQEVEAYGKQYWYVCKYKTQNKQMRFNLLRTYSEILSGPLYGGVVSLMHAMDLIREESKKHDTL